MPLSSTKPRSPNSPFMWPSEYIALKTMNSARREELAISSSKRKHTHPWIRIESGSAKQAKGTIKQVAGKVTGDAKLETEGKADKVAGKVQNAVGGAKDTLRGK